MAVFFKLKSDLHTCISLMHGISASGGTGMGSGLWWVRVRLWFIVVWFILLSLVGKAVAIELSLAPYQKETLTLFSMVTRWSSSMSHSYLRLVKS